MKSYGLAAQAVENPEILATLGEADIRGVMGTLTMVAAAAHAKWLAVLETERASKETSTGDRLLTTKQLASKLSCSPQTLVRGWKAGRYPFILKDGGRLVGSESGLERWIAARTKRQSQAHKLTFLKAGSPERAVRLLGNRFTNLGQLSAPVLTIGRLHSRAQFAPAHTTTRRMRTAQGASPSRARMPDPTVAGAAAGTKAGYWFRRYAATPAGNGPPPDAWFRK
jgi:predicted DNA-binding transcriptional regulator AlpA